MAYIGMRKPVAAVIASHTDGTAISYSTGFLIGTAVSATINQDFSDNPDYGDDVIQDNDTGMSGYTGTMETNDLTDTVRATLLGWDKTNIGTTSAPDYVYNVGDGSPPYVGFGFIRVKMYQAVKSYEAFWFHKAQFMENSFNASTKQKQISWNHPSLNISGMGAYIDSTGVAKYFDFKTFDTETAAWTWLKSKAGIT